MDGAEVVRAREDGESRQENGRRDGARPGHKGEGSCSSKESSGIEH